MDVPGTQRQRLSDLLAQLPPEWPEDPLPALQQAVSAAGTRIVVVDDDPTGTQTVHGVPVLTHWTVDALKAELASAHGTGIFFLLTNSRSLPQSEAELLNFELGRNLATAARAAGCRFKVMSRSDSTLRGHYPAEVQALATGLGLTYDATLLVPAFIAGGRYTINDTHYVLRGDHLVPAGNTEYARDAAFGYRSSNLRDWVAEKTNGRMPAADVRSIPLDELRHGGPQAVRERLLELPTGSVCVVNAASERDLGVLALGLVDAEATGRRYLCRTSASFVPWRAGLAPRPLLQPAELGLPEVGGGLIVVGSYVPRTTEQVRALHGQVDLRYVELDVQPLLASNADRALAPVMSTVGTGLARGENVLLATSREYIPGKNASSSLSIGRLISESLVKIVQALPVRPRYILAKGGITSSDLATRALGVRRAMVLGQLQPGVPVWRLGPESLFPGLIYVVFPGNVGDAQALARAVRLLQEI
jgi:uncharacterized protein YgbK (DUF1537 family)